MGENPYKAPTGCDPKNRENRLHPFLRLPQTPLEWIVIVLVLLVIAAMFLPSIDGR